MQPFELGDVLVRQEVPPQSEHLPELEKDHPALFQRFPHLDRGGPAAPPPQCREKTVTGENPENPDEVRQMARRGEHAG